ncbi:metal ABC transporter permease [Crocinitomicaceae bacterium]|nr:metal ABC transporter permease [Crocinitomicaceae bacterium]
MIIGVNDILNLVTVLAIAWSCSLLGAFLVLRKVVMVGDAISHSVLPGIAIAYVFSQSFDSYFILLGAAVFGVFTTVIIDFFHKKLKLQEDASIGITFTWLFALGVIIISLFTEKNTDLDQDCVLFGDLGISFLDKIIVGGLFYGTRSMWMIFPIFILILGFIIKGWKGLQLISFDLEYAKSKGVNVSFWHYSFMLLVSVTTVMSFESVGAILVVGLLSIPPATAFLISEKLNKLLVLSCVFSTIACVLGILGSIYFDLTMSSSIVVVSGILFVIVWLIKYVFSNLKTKAA